MGQPLTQHSFRGGEISPEFYGNTREPRHGISLRTCKNFLPIVHGALVNRPGLLDQGALAASTVRYAVFIFSDAQAIVLEFTNTNLRFWTNDGRVETAPGVPYEVATPYAAADLQRLKFTQAGDVITIFHPSYDPRELVRFSNASWTLSAPTYIAPVAIGGAGPAPSVVGASVDAPAYVAGTTYAEGDYVTLVVAGPPPSTTVWISLASNNKGNTPAAGSLYWGQAIDATHPAKEWEWALTGVGIQPSTGALNGKETETLPITVSTTSGKLALSADRPAYVFVGTILLSYARVMVYRGRAGFWGLVGMLDINDGSTFVDDGSAPDYTQQPPTSKNPFTGASDKPGCGCYHEQRLVVARSNNEPQTARASAIASFYSFTDDTRRLLIGDSDSWKFRIASQKLEEIRSVKSYGRLCLFTGQGEFSMHGADGTGITPTNVELRRHSQHGSSYLDPLEADNALLFNTAKGNYVRDFYFDFNANAFVGADLTEFARHLFRGHTIVSWAHQETPYHIVWVVRDDGVLLSMTYDRTTQTVAWAQHETEGTVLQVACIPDGTEDAVFLAVLRRGLPRMEKMAPRDYIPDTRLACFLDAALQFDGRNTGATFFTVLGASYAADAVVTVQASVASFAATDVGDEVVIDPDGEPTRVRITAYTDTTHVTGTLSNDLPEAFQATPTQSWGWARDTMTGLDHLNGLDVTVLADGFVQGPFPVVAGTIELTTPAMLVTAGLSYNSDAELLDVASDAVKPNVKSVARVILDVVGSDGITAGETFDDEDLVEAKLRTEEDDYDPTELVTGQVEIPIGSSWNTGGRACIRQSDPLPLTITAATRDVVIGGRGD